MKKIRKALLIIIVLVAIVVEHIWEFFDWILEKLIALGQFIEGEDDLLGDMVDSENK